MGPGRRAAPAPPASGALYSDGILPLQLTVSCSRPAQGAAWSAQMHMPFTGRGRPRGATLEAETIEGVDPTLPVALDPHDRVEIHPRAEQCFQFVSGLGAGLLEHRTPATDDDALLRIALDLDDDPVHEHRLTRVAGVVGVVRLPGRLEGLGRHRDRVRELVASDGEELLAHELRHQERLGLVAHD